MARTLVDLSYAATCLRPSHIPVSRPRGVKAAGLRYERAVGRELANAGLRPLMGQWFEFTDANGPGHCQTDLVLVGRARVVVIECKLTDVDAGRAQLAGLYLPVARMVWPEKRPLGIVAARHLSREEHLDLVCTTLDEAIRRAESCIPTFHWVERVPLRGTRSAQRPARKA